MNVIYDKPVVNVRVSTLPNFFTNSSKSTYLEFNCWISRCECSLNSMVSISKVAAHLRICLSASVRDFCFCCGLTGSCWSLIEVVSGDDVLMLEDISVG